ncbi:YfiM family lipoprotein [Pantoea sp. 1.19]|uniref:YfiM family lipoprotein n=1 Tax=Pantoea sp. 1.19 TaxID=1925589 RepID=UPI000948C65F|nr:YfiM family lipoprotein [Pantoea sp. 1.19]
MAKWLLCFTLCLSGCAHQAEDRWTGKDKAQHFIASAVIAAAAIEYGDRQHWSRAKSNSVGLMFSVSLGAAKELYDSRPAGSGWSWKDFAWDIAGAATGFALWNVGQ